MVRECSSASPPGSMFQLLDECCQHSTAVVTTFVPICTNLPRDSWGGKTLVASIPTAIGRSQNRTKKFVPTFHLDLCEDDSANV